MDDMDHSILERSVKTTLSNQITSFSWHPKRESRLLAISLAGSKLFNMCMCMLLLF